MVGRAEAIGGRGLSAAVRAFCIVPLATGIGDIAQGDPRRRHHWQAAQAHLPRTWRSTVKVPGV